MTIAEKILASHADKEEVAPGEYVWARVDETTASGRYLPELKRLGIRELFDPKRIFVLVDDHHAPSDDIVSAEAAARDRELVRLYGIEHFYEYGRHGVKHNVLAENGYMVPGDLIAMGDSHSTSFGVFNAAACPILVESLYVAIKGQLWFRVPETVKFWLTGALPEMCVGKDVILKIAGTYGTDVALYRAVEFLGPLAETMSLASRWTMSTMGSDIGAKFAMFEADQKTYDFLKGRTGERFYRGQAVTSDPDAVYAQEYVVDASDLKPMVACPHDPSNVKPITQVEREKIQIHQGFIGSCANGRQEDLAMAAAILEGRKVHPNVRLIVIPASMEVWRDALKAGWFDTFMDAEAIICNPTCGPCMGSQLGILAAGERCISASTRNFQGRMGSPDSEVYLGNAATVAASAVAGYIVDPRNYG
jgi:3-isopropylmalate/(R)-2-methylmalate dehydratase large subunit